MAVLLIDPNGKQKKKKKLTGAVYDFNMVTLLSLCVN